MSELVKRDNWFPNYQEIPKLGVTGKRKISSRTTFFKKEDFADATVLDIGCNTGQTCFQSLEWTAKHATGIEYDEAAFKLANKYRDQLGLDRDRCQFILEDADNPTFWASIPQSDVVLLLAFIGTKELENRYGILSKAAKKANKVLYLEGHNPVSQSQYVKDLLIYSDFTSISSPGYTRDHGRRAFVRCSREILNTESCIKLLSKMTHKKIVFIGKSASGKTTLRRAVEKAELDYPINDDLEWITGPQKGFNTKRISEVKWPKKFILFDYRGVEYIRDADVVFFVTRGKKDISSTGNIKKDHRGPPMPFDHLNNIKEFHTVVI